MKLLKSTTFNFTPPHKGFERLSLKHLAVDSDFFLQIQYTPDNSKTR